MPATRIPIDGLWRCLCPSIDAIARSQSRASVKRCQIRPIHHRTEPASLRLDKRIQSQYLHNKAEAKQYPQKNVQSRINAAKQFRGVFDSTDLAATSYKNLDDVPVSELHDSLHHISAGDGIYKKTARLVEYLITSRGEKPSLLHYNALIRASADASHGSAEVVGNLFREMKEGHIVPDSGLYHSILQTLAIHPDYLLRSQVLQEMKDRWFTLTNDGWHNVVVGLLRDRQYEMALDRLENMQKEDIKIHPWLYDIFIYIFCETEELDEALRLLRHRIAHGDMDISANVWYHVLDACSTNYHYEGTLFSWKKRVETEYINPSDGMCTNVLNTAARYHDAHLATDVARVLAGRTSKLERHHYEALIQAYTGSFDLKSAFHILSIMKKARLEPTEATTRSIYARLTESKEMPCQAFKTLESFHRNGHVIPTAAINVIIEASVSQGQLQEAVSLYKSVHRICTSGPNTMTFNAILQGCSKTPGSKNLSMFLASEMVALGIRPDILTYDRLILVCLTEEDYEDAFKYLEELEVTFKRSELRMGTLTALVRKCISAGDTRAWDLLEEIEKRGSNVGKLRAWAEEAWQSRVERSVVSEELPHTEKGHRLG